MRQTDKTFSSDYHDYVIKGGEFVGDFEGMYQHSAEVPWQQDKISEYWHRKIAINFLEAAFEYSDIKSVLEIGCGYGYLSSAIKREGIDFYACDVSPTAIAKAKQREKHVSFFTDDILSLQKRRSYELVIAYEVIWYLCHKLDLFLENVKKMADSYIALSLAFPRKDKSFYAKDILPDSEKLLEILEKRFDTLATLRLQKPKRLYPEDGENFYFLGRVK